MTYIDKREQLQVNLLNSTQRHLEEVLKERSELAQRCEEQRQRIEELTAEYQRDAERYRFIRDNPWEGTDSVLESVIVCQMSGVWDSTIDAAMGELKWGNRQG